MDRYSPSKVAHFGAAYRRVVSDLWRLKNMYIFPKEKGFTAYAWADTQINSIMVGGLRNVSLTDPALIETCRDIGIPCTYKSLELYLRSGPMGYE